ncbi:hypothetical protein E2986_11154 [Frieseomelitta varia]|uniref:Uncharacterized protein n=1 Tax=Frieseomelitta varia TaxID=561572 RepID=A0A833SJJ3_9HYME|nr:hypothetical protein E2986_11154 [Frieseomelitta varia]
MEDSFLDHYCRSMLCVRCVFNFRIGRNPRMESATRSIMRLSIAVRRGCSDGNLGQCYQRVDWMCGTTENAAANSRTSTTLLVILAELTSTVDCTVQMVAIVVVQMSKVSKIWSRGHYSSKVSKCPKVSIP